MGARLELHQLNVAGKALAAATQYAQAYPGPVFTSGRRTIPMQAAAMAANVMANSHWIQQTYVPSPPAHACQQWVDAATRPMTEKTIASAFTLILAGFTDTTLASLSRHLSGYAFDVLPLVGHQGEARVKLLHSMATFYGGKFLEHEGGLVRWHWEAIA